MISVERVLDYTKLPSEAPLEVEEKKKPASDWPHQGVITADRACLRYSQDAPLVLKDLNFNIRPKEKVRVSFERFYYISKTIWGFTLQRRSISPLSALSKVISDSLKELKSHHKRFKSSTEPLSCQYIFVLKISSAVARVLCVVHISKCSPEYFYHGSKQYLL